MFERLLVVCYQSSVGLSQFSVLLLKAVILSVIVSLHFLLLLWFSFCRWLFSYLFLSSPLCFCQRVFLVIFYSTPSLFLYSHSVFLCFYQWAVILLLWSIQQQKNLQIWGGFIALGQIIDEECLFVSILAHSHGQHHYLMGHAAVLYKLTLLTPVSAWWDESGAYWMRLFISEYFDWFTQKHKNLSKLKVKSWSPLPPPQSDTCSKLVQLDETIESELFSIIHAGRHEACSLCLKEDHFFF